MAGADVTSRFPPTYRFDPGIIPATVVAGKVVVDTTAKAMPSTSLVNGAIITASLANAGTTWVGDSSVAINSGYPLSPGASTSISIANLGALYIVGTAGDVLNYVGS